MQRPCAYSIVYTESIGVRANIHLGGGGQTEFCPNGERKLFVTWPRQGEQNNNEVLQSLFFDGCRVVPDARLLCYPTQNVSQQTLSLPLFPFVRGEVMPATFSLPHLLVFSTLLCLVSSSSSLPPLLPSSHLSLHSPPISALASLVSSCPALVILPLPSVIGHRPSFLRVQPTVI